MKKIAALLVGLLVSNPASTGQNALALTRAPGGDDTLLCEATSMAAEANEPITFANDSCCRGADTDATIHLGLNGVEVDLYRRRGASLIRGGLFVSKSKPTTTLQVTTPVFKQIYNGHGEEESYVLLRAAFVVSQANAKVSTTGEISCSVYDLDYFLKEECGRTNLQVGQACR